jgi:toxin HigB-1
MTMILSFRCADTEALFVTGKSRRFANIKNVAERKLTQLQAAMSLESLKAPPGNRLEALVGDRQGQHSIRINDQWRLCFVWTQEGVRDVEIVDYHQ